MALFKAKLETYSEKASPCFRTFLLGNVFDRVSPMRTSLHVYLKHVLISLNISMGIPSAVIVFHSTSLLTES